jgi:hypothetical protein
VSKSGDPIDTQAADQSSQVRGDTITVGGIERSGAVAIGRGARATINQYTEIIVKADNFEDLPPAPGEPPYKGLAYFTEADKDIYFGREKLSDQLVERLQKSRFLALIGASGSGKSSLLRAGIIPRLRARNWVIHVMTPGAHPLSVLAASLTQDELDPASADSIVSAMADNPQTLAKVGEKLAARKNAERLLLAVDQLEELFTQCKDPDERRIFVDNLIYAAQAGGAPTILLSMRADYYDRVSEFAVLTDVVSQQQHYVMPMSQEDLVRVIAEPARLGGWQFVEGLVEQIIEDVGREPGRLPLLSHAQLETWERRRGVVMTLGGYRDAGGVEGAIAQSAEDTLQLLGHDKEPVVKHIFLLLTQPGEGAEDTRRVASKQELLRFAADQNTINDVVDALATARLITIDKDQVQVAHEALIRRWPRLQSWIDEDRERLSFNRRLQRAVETWESADKDDDYLYRGSQLTQAESRIEEYGSWPLSPSQVEFIEASKALAAREALEAQEIERTGFENALLLYGFAGIGGALGNGGAALLISVTARVGEFLAPWYVLAAMVFGVFTGLIYVAFFDRLVAGVREGPDWKLWLVSILSGALAFTISLWSLTIIFGALPGIILGAIWGAFAGAGRLWIQRSDRDKRFNIPLVALLAGIALSSVYQLAQRLSPQLFAAWPVQVPAWVMLVVGVFVPLTILVVDEYAASYFSGRRKK